MLNEFTRAELAEELWKAECASTPVGPITDRFDGLEEADAYGVQAAVAAIRHGLGHRMVGKKIGLTSAAMQQLVGLAEPDFGYLFDAMEVPNGGDIVRGSLIAPKVEPEIAFVLKARLEGPGVTPRQVLAATECVIPAIEIIDSRIADWRIRWHDTVADNGSSCRFVLADRAFSPLGLDFEAITVGLEQNGRVEAAGTMRDVLGSPLRSVCWLVRKLAESGASLEPGEVVLPGSPCRALAAAAGDAFRADFGSLASVTVRFVDDGVT